MTKSSTLNGVLIGLIVVLAGVILVQSSGNNPARAATDDDAAAPGGIGIAANGVIAVTGQYAEDYSVLYLIDTNREVVLTYACHSKTRSLSGAFKNPMLDFLNGRLYTWDAIYAQKALMFGETGRAAPGWCRDRVQAKMEED